MTPRAGRAVLPALGALSALYLAVPVVAFVVRVVRDPGRGGSAPGLWSSVVVSVVAASVAVALIVLFGLPLAYVLARSRSVLGRVVSIAVQLPLALPPLMGGILLVYLVGPYTTLGRFFGGRLTESFAGVVLAQTFVAAPFLITVAKAAFAAVDPGLDDVARTLGFGPVARYARVALPAARQGVRAGLILAWLRAFGEYGAVAIIAYHPYSLPVFTYLQFGSTGLPSTEAPTAIGLGAAALAVAFAELPPFRWRRVHPLPAPSLPVARAVAPPRIRAERHYGAFHLDVDITAAARTVAIVGPSGSGKSLTLRALAGLFDPERHAPSRAIAYVPQGYGLMPHLRVRDQVRFGRRHDPGLAAYWVERLGLTPLADRLPDALSGGERQRVAIARALATDPDLLLLDEPFAALDAPVRAALRMELRALQRATGIACVLVTHDPEEAAVLAEEIVVLSAGSVLQSGSRRSVFAHPASPVVAGLLEVENVLPGTVDGGGMLELGGGGIPVRGDLAGSRVTWSVRAAEVLVTSPADAAITGTVVDVVDHGTSEEVHVVLTPGGVVRSRTGVVAPEVGSTVGVAVDPAAVTVWPAAPEPSERAPRTVDTAG